MSLVGRKVLSVWFVLIYSLKHKQVKVTQDSSIGAFRHPLVRVQVSSLILALVTFPLWSQKRPIRPPYLVSHSWAPPFSYLLHFFNAFFSQANFLLHTCFSIIIISYNMSYKYLQRVVYSFMSFYFYIEVHYYG